MKDANSLEGACTTNQDAKDPYPEWWPVYVAGSPGKQTDIEKKGKAESSERQSSDGPSLGELQRRAEQPGILDAFVMSVGTFTHDE